MKKIIGFLLILAAAVGFIFSVAGLIEVWRYRPVVTHSVTDTLALFDQTLKTTQEGLTIVGEVVQTTTSDVDSLQTTTRALAQTIQDTNPMIDSLTNLTGKDFPASIKATQTSLASAQSSALLIDNILTAITSIPFLQVQAYKPEVPLHTSLARVSASMNSLPPALDTITSSLEDSKTNLGVLEVELNKISETTQGLSTALGSAQDVIDQYKDVTAQLKQRVEGAQRAAPGWITTLTWILTIGLGWLTIAQVGLCTQGLDMLRSRRDG